jgi:hypothetical protein
MRFGRDLYRNRIPEWSAAYLKYDELKRSIKFATKSALDDGSQVEGQGEDDFGTDKKILTLKRTQSCSLKFGLSLKGLRPSFGNKLTSSKNGRSYRQATMHILLRNLP